MIGQNIFGFIRIDITKSFVIRWKKLSLYHELYETIEIISFFVIMSVIEIIAQARNIYHLHDIVNKITNLNNLKDIADN